MDISLSIEGFTSTINIRTLRWEGQAGYPVGANLITCFLKSREPFPLVAREGRWQKGGERVNIADFQGGGRGWRHGEQVALRSWESKWTGSLFQEERACPYLWLSWGPIWNLWRTELWESECAVFFLFVCFNYELYGSLLWLREKINTRLYCCMWYFKLTMRV